MVVLAEEAAAADDAAEKAADDAKGKPGQAKPSKPSQAPGPNHSVVPHLAYFLREGTK